MFSESFLFKIHRVEPNGILKTIKLEVQDENEVSSTTIDDDPPKWSVIDEDVNKPNLTYAYSSDEDPVISLIKLGSLDEMNPMNYVATVDRAANESEGKYVFTLQPTQPKRPLKLPDATMISCQNCEMSFPTKYQYQRHQCEFNADKVVLKPEVIGKDLEKATRTKYECEVCNKTFISNNNLERHKNCHISTTNNICEFCKKTFVSENRLKIHRENHCKKASGTTKFYRSDVVVWHCESCKEVFAAQDSAARHLKSCKTDFAEFEVKKNEESPYLKKVVTENLYQCEFCNRTYIDKKFLLEHQHQHTTENNYQCVFCGQSFDGYVEATTHWQNKCSEEPNMFYLPKMIYCEQCDRGFKSHELLYSHKNKKKHFSPKSKSVSIPRDIIDLEDSVKAADDSDAKNEQSDSLDDTVIIKEEDDEHREQEEEKSGKPEQQEQTSELPRRRGRKRKVQKNEGLANACGVAPEGFAYQCEKCGMVESSFEILDTHKNVAHATIFRCEQCGQILHSAKALMIHCRAHQSLKPYVCDQCGRSYSQTSHLWQHMRFHQGIKPFACPHEGCEARYTIRPDLKDHIRKVHTRERPFKCSVCNKCFLTGSVYYQHRLIHTNDRRYGCEICNKRFFRADALNNHRRIHTDERPYPCPICGRHFRQKGDRNKHVRTQHPM